MHQVYPCLRQAGWTIEPGIRDARIGGSRRADRNLISGNNIGGIYVGIGDSLKTRGNLIGVTAHDLVFGGDTATKANVVAHAFRDGIAIDGTGTGTGVSVWILRSSIHANGDLAIDLGIDGVTPWT